VSISTIFLGVDHAWFGGPPVLWETMVFGGKDDELQYRFTNEIAALKTHWFLVNQTRKRQTKKYRHISDQMTFGRWLNE